MNFVRPAAIFAVVLATFGLHVTAQADRKLPDWDAPTADQRVIRAKDKAFINERIYSGIKTIEEWTVQFRRAVEKGDASALTYLVRLAKKRNLEINLNAPIDDDQNTALHILAKSTHTAALKVLLKFGADANSKNTRGNTPLHLAVLARYDAAAKLLIKHAPATLKSENVDGDIALTLAIRTQNETLALFLAKRTSQDDLDALQMTGKYLKKFAFDSDNPVAFKVYTQKTGPSRDDVFETAKTNSPQVLKAVLADKRLKLSSENVDLLLDEMILIGNIETVLELAKRYPRVLKWKNDEGENLVHIAAKRESLYALAEFERLGLSINKRNFRGETPLDLAKNLKIDFEKTAKPGNVPYVDVIAYLEKKKKPDLLERLGGKSDAEPIVRVYELIKKGHGKRLVQTYGLSWLSSLVSRLGGFSLLHLAVIKGEAAVVKALLELGCPPSVADSGGLYPNGLAFYSLNSKVKEVFTSHQYSTSDPDYSLVLPDDYMRSYDEQTILFFIENGWLKPTPDKGSTILTLGAKMNSVKIIEAAYARGESPFDEIAAYSLEKAPLFTMCSPATPKALDAFLKHPGFSDLKKVRAASTVYTKSGPAHATEIMLLGGARSISARCHSEDMGLWLLKSGILPDDKMMQVTLLDMMLRLQDDNRAVKALLDAGVDPNSRYSDDETGHLLTAFWRGRSQDDAIDILINHGAVVDRATFTRASEVVFAHGDALTYESNRPKENEIFETRFDKFVRADALQIESNLAFHRETWRRADERSALKIKFRNEFLARVGKVRNQARANRDCAEAQTASQAEFLAAHSKAEDLFDFLWKYALREWKYVAKEKSQNMRALLSTLDPRNLEARYFREKTYRRGTAVYDVDLIRVASPTFFPLCAFSDQEEHDSLVYDDYEPAPHIEPLRWACLRAFEQPKIETFGIKASFGAFEKNGSAKPLSAAAVKELLKTAPDQLDVGLQVAIANEDGTPVARVKISLWPLDAKSQKDDRKLDFLKELGLDRVENYLAKQYPHCASTVRSKISDQRSRKNAAKMPSDNSKTSKSPGSSRVH